MSDYKEKFLLGRSLGEGGFAEVFSATDRRTREVVALKRLKTKGADRAEAIARMRREIDVQQQLAHHNVMPILEADPDDDPTWFTMPVASYNIEERRRDLSDDDDALFSMISDVATALVHAHGAGHVHRDVAPRNILFLEQRWVLADWGLVRRPLGQTTTALTHGPMGHPPYMAPETWVDPHQVTGAADVHSLGRVISYVLSGRHPSPSDIELPMAPAWRRVVAELAHKDPNRRPAAGNITALVRQALEKAASSPSRIKSLLKNAERDHEDLAELAAALALVPTQHEDVVFVDILPDVEHSVLAALVTEHPAETVTLAERVCEHLINSDWYGRDFDSLNRPLRVLWILADAAASDRNFDALRSLAESLFRADGHCDRFRSRDRVRDWLCTLRGKAAVVVAEALVRCHEARAFYLQGGWTPSRADRAIADAFDV